VQLLTTGNPKIAKGEGLGYLTSILHLAPANLSGHNVCPMASVGCKAACLNTAGRGGIFRKGETTNVIQKARIARTNFFFQDRPAFMRQLVKEIRSAIRKAEKNGLTAVFRLNGTSDLRWETVPVEGHLNVMAMFPTIQFYDYTKLPNRRGIPSNYHLTFSRSEENDALIPNVITRGTSVAVVFNGKTLPESYLGFPVVNGDTTDLRFLDPRGVIVGLKAKGKAKKDASGFVVAA